jgi:ribonuclease Z
VDRFDLHILGCGSALPTRNHLPSAQILNVRNKLFMIDCGEGAQLQFRRTKLNFNRIYDIFISHLHGDHCFGLLGLISSMGMLGRTAPLTIYGHRDLEVLFKPLFDFFCKGLPFDVKFIAYNPNISELIYEDRSIQVYTIPLNHRIPTAGFLFRETIRERHILKEMIDFYNIPLKCIPAIKKGEDYVTPDGETVVNERLTIPPTPSRSYAYCSDTAPTDKIIPIIKDVDLLYHEATFAKSESKRAKSTMHSTAEDAATVAKKANVKKLIIGHYSARYSDDRVLLNEARLVFDNTILADENMCIEI